MIFSTHNCISYLLHLGVEQARILNSRHKIEEVLSINETPEDIKKKLELVQSARKFAIETLDMNPKGGFVYFVQVNREEIGWHVTASYPLEFKSYTWWFPIVGSVPYKGYFSKEKAVSLENELKQQGLDTRLRITAGYSTLGWFSDPVFSTQLKGKEYEIVELVFHEMAHSTVYFDGDSIFNESYASFLEEQGAKDYYISLKNENSDKIVDLINKQKMTSSLIIKEVKKTAIELDQMFKSSTSQEEKLKRKKEIIEAFKNRVIEQKENFPNLDINKFKAKEMNNEDFIGTLRYNSGEEFFKAKFEELGKDYKKFHEEMRKLEKLKIKERHKLILGKELTDEG